MPTSQNLSSFVINKVESEEVYNYMKDNNLLNDNELYLTPDSSSALYKPFKVTISGTESDGSTTYSSDKTYSQIKAAFDDGNYYIYAVLEGWSGLYRLTQCSESAVFDASDPYWFSQVKILSDGSVEVNDSEISSNDFTVTATLASLALTTATVDKTLAEIEAAYQAGKNISCTLVISGNNGARVKLTNVERLTLSGAFVFSGLAASYMSSTETYAAVFLKITSNGNTFTTKTLT